MLSLSSLAFAALACFSIAAASPVEIDSRDSRTAKFEARQAVNCTSLTSGISTACWDELDIPSYLAEWNRTVPHCQITGGDGTGCCHPQEPWTTCFLRLAYGNPDSDCTTLNLEQCSLNQISPDPDPSIASKVAYVVRNIVAINNLFGSYYEGGSMNSSLLLPVPRPVLIAPSSLAKQRYRRSGLRVDELIECLTQGSGWCGPQQW